MEWKFVMLVDLKPNDLKKYNGISPCPDDIDEFWDSSIAEMKAIDPEVTLKKVMDFPNAECFELYFTGMDGARVFAKYARPKNITKPADAVLCFHGYWGKSGNWTSLLSWTGQGFCVAALDCRGQAGKSEDVGGVVGNTLHGHIIRGLETKDPKKLLYRSIFLDTAQLAKIVMGFDEVNEERVSAFGGSQGGALTLACASLEPRIYKAAACYPFLSDYRRVWEMDLAENAYKELKEYFRSFDPRHEREDEIFELLGYIDIQNITKRIKGEVKMFTGLMDVVCPPSTQFAAYNKITSPKDVTFYPDFGHEDLPDVGDIVMQWFLEK